MTPTLPLSLVEGRPVVASDTLVGEVSRSRLLSILVAALVFDTLAQISIGTRYGASPPVRALGSRSIVHLANYGLLGVAAVAVLRTQRPFARRPAGARTCIKAVVPYLGVWVIAAFLGAFPGAPKDAWTSLFATFALLVLPASVSDRLRAARLLVRTVVGLSLFAALATPSWAFAPYDVWPGGWRPGLPRLEGVFPQPNPMGWFAAFAVLVELADASPLRRRLLPVAASLTCLVLSGSRTGLFALVIAYVVALMAQQRLRVSGRVIAWAIAGAGMWAVVHVLGQSTTSGNTLNGRQATWRLALTVWRANPLIGTGPGAYINHVATGQAIGYAHNQPLQTLAEAGLFGAAALIWLTVSLITFAWRVRVVAPYAAAAATALWVALYGTENVLRFTSVPFMLPIAGFLLLLSSVERRELPGRPLGARSASPSNLLTGSSWL